MNLHASTPEEIAECSLRLSYVPSLNVGGITCRDYEGNHLATLLFDYWTVNAAQIHMWIEHPRALEHNFLPNEAWKYLRSHNRMLALGVTPGDNVASLKLQHALGFVEKYRIVDGWAKGVDMVISEKRLDDE